MAKRFTASQSQLRPDPRYNSKLVSKFVNCLMYDGKKSVAQRAFYAAMDTIQKRVPDQEPLEVFTQAIDNVKPNIEVRSKRVGGATYQVPTPVNPRRQQTLSIRCCWKWPAAKKAARSMHRWLTNSSPRTNAKVRP